MTVPYDLGKLPDDYVPFDQMKQPKIEIPQRHDLDAEQLAKLVSEYEAEFCRLNGVAASDWSAGQYVAKFRKAVIAQDRSIIETLERGEARRAAEAKERADRTAAANKSVQDAARAEVETYKERKKRMWLVNGGSEAGFSRWWETHGEVEYMSERMQQAESRVARVGRNY